MSEHSATAFFAIVAGALVAAALVVVDVVALGGGVASHAVTSFAAISACAVSFSDAHLMPLALAIPLGFGLASLAGFGRGLVVFRHERRILRSLPLERVEVGELAQSARSMRIPLYTTGASRPAAFCFGLLRPRVVVTSGLLERLSVDEQTAAFWHEAQHARAREPLRSLLARLAQSTFFWLPLLRDLFARYMLVRELDADRLATLRTSPSALAGALCEVVMTPAVNGAVGFADLAGARVDRLLDPATPLPSLFRWRNLALSGVALALLAFAFAYPAKVAVASHSHHASMMMEVSVMTPSGVRTMLVPCG